MTENKELNNEEITQEQIKKMGLVVKIAIIQKEVKELVKDEENKHQHYKFFEESQILKILKPLLEKYRVRMVISDDLTQPFIYQREEKKHFIQYAKIMKLTNWDKLDEVETYNF